MSAGKSIFDNIKNIEINCASMSEAVEFAKKFIKGRIDDGIKIECAHISGGSFGNEVLPAFGKYRDKVILYE